MDSNISLLSVYFLLQYKADDYMCEHLLLSEKHNSRISIKGFYHPKIMSIL